MRIKTQAAGVPCRITLATGGYELDSSMVTFDDSTVASEIWIAGEPTADAMKRPVLRPALAAQLLLIVMARGAPPVHIRNVRLIGKLSVEDGKLDLIDCSIEGTGGSATSQAPTSRAVAIVGGRVSLTRTVLHGHPGGAIAVEGATLILVDSSVHDCSATFGGATLVRGNSSTMIRSSNFTSNSASVSGGALHVGGDAIMTIESSAFVENSAQTSGGALQVCTMRDSDCVGFLSQSHESCLTHAQVDGGEVNLLDRTLFERNSAPDGGGASIRLSGTGKCGYTLPSPAGRWLSIRQGLSLQLPDGAAEDLDFPYGAPRASDLELAGISSTGIIDQCSVALA